MIQLKLFLATDLRFVCYIEPFYIKEDPSLIAKANSLGGYEFCENNIRFNDELSLLEFNVFLSKFLLDKRVK